MNQRITIASRQPGFAWAGRRWNTEPVVVEVVATIDDADGDQVPITVEQFDELQRQCAYPLYPLRIGAVDDQVERKADVLRELADVQARISAERTALDELKAERAKVDKALKSARDRHKTTERKLQEAEEALEAANARATAAESKQTEIQVEPKPDPNRNRN